jgi:hypothetical protein
MTQNQPTSSFISSGSSLTSGSVISVYPTTETSTDKINELTRIIQNNYVSGEIRALAQKALKAVLIQKYSDVLPQEDPALAEAKQALVDFTGIESNCTNPVCSNFHGRL